MKVDSGYARYAVVSATVLLLSMPLSAQAPAVLETTGDFPGGGHLWISAAAAADAEKIIDLDRVGSDALRRRVEKQRQAIGDRTPIDKARPGEKPLIATIPPSECKSVSMLVDERGGFGSSATLADLVFYSELIVRGTIRTVDLGFSFGSPTSLLGVEVSEVFKGTTPRSPFYVDYPIARFRIGPFSFCNSNQGFEPRPGDEILLFAYRGPVDKDNVLYSPRLDQMFFESQSGVLFLPTHLRKTPDLKSARTLSDVTSRLRFGHGQESPRGGQ